MITSRMGCGEPCEEELVVGCHQDGDAPTETRTDFSLAAMNEPEGPEVAWR
jgi:hypothetical protein